MFCQDERDRILVETRPWAKARGFATTDDGAYAAFAARARDHLHIVLMLSPIGDAIRARCWQFPSFVNCCTIDWYLTWPQEALLSVSKRVWSAIWSSPLSLCAPILSVIGGLVVASVGTVTTPATAGTHSSHALQLPRAGPPHQLAAAGVRGDRAYRMQVGQAGTKTTPLNNVLQTQLRKIVQSCAAFANRLCQRGHNQRCCLPSLRQSTPFCG